MQIFLTNSLYKFLLLLNGYLLQSEDNIRNVELKFYFYPGMRLDFLMFITAVCFLFIHTLVLGLETSVDVSPQNNHLLDHRQFKFV